MSAIRRKADDRAFRRPLPLSVHWPAPSGSAPEDGTSRVRLRAFGYTSSYGNAAYPVPIHSPLALYLSDMASPNAFQNVLKLGRIAAGMSAGSLSMVASGSNTVSTWSGPLS